MVDLKLVSYIKENLAKGYTKEELKQILKENGWSSLEVDEAFEKIERPVQQVQQPAKTVEIPSELISFVRQAFQKGIDEARVKSALSAKGWPPETINKAIQLGKPKQELQPQKQVIQQVQQQRPAQQPVQIKQEKPAKPFKEHKPVNTKAILTYVLAGIILTGILGLTIGLYYNVQGITEYKIVDPQTGKEYFGRCKEATCQEMKDFAWQNVLDNLYLIIAIAAVLGILGVVLFAFLSNQRQIIVWVYNLGYLLFLIFIAYVWFNFRIATQ